MAVISVLLPVVNIKSIVIVHQSLFLESNISSSEDLKTILYVLKMKNFLR